MNKYYNGFIYEGYGLPRERMFPVIGTHSFTDKQEVVEGKDYELRDRPPLKFETQEEFDEARGEEQRELSQRPVIVAIPIESHTSTDTGKEEKAFAKYQQDVCSHDWQSYKQCCYCGAFENFRGEIIDRRTQGNVEAIRLAFIDWWMGCKDTNGNNPPLAIQVFHWFDTHVGIFVSDTSPRVMNLESIIRLKEKERQEWADMCIKKQARIEQLEEKILIIQQQPK